VSSSIYFDVIVCLIGFLLNQFFCVFSVRNERGSVDLRMLMSTLNWRENAIPHPREDSRGGDKSSEFTSLSGLEVDYRALLNKDQ